MRIDSERRKVIIEFAEPDGKGRWRTFTLEKQELLKKIGERAFRAIELLGQEFYIQDGVIITANPDKMAVMDVRIIL